MKKEQPITYNSIVQANAITESRYNFNRLEKNALYCIIRQVRKEYVDNPDGSKEYSNMKVVMPEKVLIDIADETHKKDAREALIALRHRDININYPDGSWLNIGFVNYAEFNEKNKVFEVEVSSKIMPYLVDLASRYTEYSLTVAITLKSKWAQRFYELCCQYRNHLEGGVPTFHKDIAQLRRMFCLEDTYPKLPDFKSRVIDTAQKELKDSFNKKTSDLWFEYVQTGRGENAEFKFIIHTETETKAQIKQFRELSEMAHAVYKDLLAIFPKDAKFCEKCWKHILLHPDITERLYGKINRIVANYPKGSDRAKVTRWMLDEDFGINKKSV